MTSISYRIVALLWFYALPCSKTTGSIEVLFGVWAQVGPLYLVLCEGLDLRGEKEIQSHPPAQCEVYEMFIIGQCYLIGGSSNAAFPCHFCNNLLLFTSTGSVVRAAVDVSKAFDTVGRWQLFQSLVTAGIPYSRVTQAVWWLDEISEHFCVCFLWNWGVHQGGIVLCILFCSHLMDYWKTEGLWFW